MSPARLILLLLSSLLLCLRPPGVVAEDSDAPQAAALLKVAAVQIVHEPGKTPAGQVVEYMERAAADGVELIVFPEYHLGHIAVPSAATDQVASAAKRLAINVIVGCIEVESEDVFYNSALIFDRHGEIAGIYRKTHAAVGEPPYFWPARGDELEANMTPGDELPVFDLDFGRVGIFTCYDGYFPEVPQALSLQGAEILVWINGRAGPVEDFMVRTMTYQTYTAMIATNTAHGWGTTIAQFPATVLAVSPNPETDYITATIDLDHLREFRANSRVFHQRRPEVYAPLVQSWEPWRAYGEAEE